MTRRTRTVNEAQASFFTSAPLPAVEPERHSSTIYDYKLDLRRVGEQLAPYGPLLSPADTARLLQAYVGPAAKEHLIVLALNVRNQPLALHTAYLGSVHTSVVRLAEVFTVPCMLAAAAIIVAHNHPSGDPSPSGADLSLTRQLVQAGALLDIQVLDHLVLGSEGRYQSLKEAGLFSS